ncbi:hypothetical protein UFOVP386_12 [uncultured Caudovirales phage]|uniref:Uncharacterized protein n=1 Tax=uncultured Caudovirales phage TaxID=2100421 RepID=A0A6J7X6E3_9CAUD|nr:hypothetical protein UFOVP386_12 [uncultured Caudovirales phage]
METTIFESLIDYGVLGILCIAMGWMLYNYWKKDQREKKKLMDMLDDCNEKRNEYENHKEGN